MRKQDIKPGVVYAYQDSKYHKAEPIVFLTTPADGVLYERRDSRDSGSPEPRYVRAAPGAGPASGRGSYFARTVGYPVASLDSRDARPDDLLKATLAGFEAVTGTSDDDFAYHLETRLARITGPWEEVAAEREAQDRAGKERRQRRQQVTDAARARARDAAKSLAAHGISAAPVTRARDFDSLVLSVDDAEKLATLLSASTKEAGE